MRRGQEKRKKKKGINESDRFRFNKWWENNKTSDITDIIINTIQQWRRVWGKVEALLEWSGEGPLTGTSELSSLGGEFSRARKRVSAQGPPGFTRWAPGSTLKLVQPKKA